MKYASPGWVASPLDLLPYALAFALSGVGCAQHDSVQTSSARSGTGGSSGTVGTGGNGSTSGSGGTIITGGSSGTSGTSGTSGSGGTSGVPDASGTGDEGGPGAEGGTGDEAGPLHTASCLDGITDYEDAGPFKYDARSSGSVNLWVPQVPAGCKVPVIHLANATGARCSDYGDALDRIASHGFLTTCYEDTNTGAGTQGITAFDTALMMYPELADKKLGSTGHNEGGQAAFAVLQLAEAKYGAGYVFAGLAMEPESGSGTMPAGGSWQTVYGEIKSPAFMFNGTADGLVSANWVGQAYSAMNPTSEVYWWSATGATSVPTPLVPEEQVSIPWFRWKLLGDNAACKFFKAMPGNAMISPGWTRVMSENEVPCH